MSTPTPAYRGTDIDVEPRTGIGIGGWIVVNRVIATVALLFWVGNQLAHGVAVREGPQYVCLSKGPSESAQALGASSLGTASGERTFFPPTFVCGYPNQDGQQPWVYVDMYPAGPWIFWICLSVLALTTVLAVILRRRARL